MRSDPSPVPLTLPNVSQGDWLPSSEHPIVRGAAGQPTSLFGDQVWDLSPIAGRPCSISFWNRRGAKHALTAENAYLLRVIAAWFLFGERREITAKTVVGYVSCLKPLFAYYSSLPKPVLASDIYRYDYLISDELARTISPSLKTTMVRVLHELYGAREEIGFIVMTPKQISSLAMRIQDHSHRQTPFVPPRIWLYQAERTQAFLEDYLLNMPGIEGIFMEALLAYVDNYGDVERAVAATCNRRNPFSTSECAKAVKLGTFLEVADRHGVSDVIRRWTLPAGAQWDPTNKFHSIRKLSRYLNQVSYVGHHHLIAWSGMRDAEASSLRSDCLLVEDHLSIGRVYSLRGASTKTLKDDDARWVTGPEAEVAVAAMRSVAKMRMEAAKRDPRVPKSDELENPYLETLSYEPWCVTGDVTKPLSYRPSSCSIRDWRAKCPNLFDERELCIQAEDARVARLVEPTLCQEKFALGRPWTFHAHQFRRSIMVSMAGSGVVSLESQQLQAKHVVKHQTVYYSRGFSALRFNQSFANELVAERYASAARLCKDLGESHWMSPFGPDHKTTIVSSLHHFNSVTDISRSIARGHISVRLTLFGVCTRRDHCPYGGWEDYAHCPTCTEALLDARKRPAISEMGRTIAIRLVDVPQGVPLRSALEHKLKAIGDALDVTDELRGEYG